MTQRGIALVAHDSKKSALLAWAAYNRELLARHHLYATGTTEADPGATNRAVHDVGGPATSAGGRGAPHTEVGPHVDRLRTGRGRSP